MGIAAGYPHWHRLVYWKYSSAVVGLLLLLLTTLLGYEAGGARRWLALGGFRFEPVELVRVLLVIFLAGYLSQARKLLQGTKGKFLGLSLPEPRYVGPLVTMWILFMFVLVAQRDRSGLSFWHLPGDVACVRETWRTGGQRVAAVAPDGL